MASSTTKRASRSRRTLRPAGRATRRSLSCVGWLLAASIALVLLSAGGVWLGLGSRTLAPTATQPIPSPSIVQVDARWRPTADAAVAELEQALSRNEGQLDTATVRVLHQSLAVIDRAIAQAQRALKRDPGSNYLNLHLANTMRQKIELLRRANALAAGQS